MKIDWRSAVFLNRACFFFPVLVGYGKLVNGHDFISAQNVVTVCMSMVSMPQPLS